MTIDTQNYSIEAMELGPMENFIYLIRDHESGRVAVVDPAWEVDKVIAKVAQMDGSRITDILLTHSHHDHINGIAGVLQHYDAEIHLLKAESAFWGQYQDASSVHHGGEQIILGDTKIDILHTPGHTPGSACYKVGKDLIAGDTLFVFGCGRCDLAGGDAEQMFDTLRKIQTDLPMDTILHPGHNYAEKTTSTLQEQVDGNPFLHFHKSEDFVRYRMHEHDRVRDTPYAAVPR